MFGLFNKNKTFAPLATDMHCHLLPGVDDGSSNISETISCLKTLYSVGFKKIYFTPHFQAHYPNNEEDIKQRFAELKKTLEKEKIDDMPEVIDVAGEYRFDDKFARIPGVDNVLTLPGKRLLCEFSLHFNNFSPLSLFEEYIKMGYKLILAHPERYTYYSRRRKRYEQLHNAGARFQVNILSFTGYFGEEARDSALWFAHNGMIDYLGSDMHNVKHAHIIMDYLNSKEWKKLAPELEQTVKNDMIL